MRVRPFFWFLLVFVCVGVLTFAANTDTYAPAFLQVHIQQYPTAAGFTTLELHLTDPEGLPIEKAQVSSSARMTNMSHGPANQSSIRDVGHGNYVAQIRLYMVGPWEIKVTAHAEGFASPQQTLLVQVV